MLKVWCRQVWPHGLAPLTAARTALAKLAGYSGGTMDKLQAGITALRGQADVQRGEQSNVQRPQALLGEQVAAAAEGDEADLCSLLRHGANVNEVNKGSTMHAFAYIAELSLTIYHELQAANYNVKDCEGLAVTVQELHRILMQCGSGTALNDSWLADGNALTVTIIDVHHTLQDARNLVDEVDRLRDLFLIKQLAGAKSMRDQFRSVKESLHTHMRTLSLYMQVNGQQRHDEAMTPFSALKQQRMGTSYSAPFMHYAPPDGAPALPPPHWLNASSSAPIYQQFQQPHQQHHAHSSAPPAAAATPYPGLQHQQKQKQQQYAMAHHASVQWYGRPMSEDGAFAAAGAPLLSPSGPSASSGSHPRVASASGASYHHGQQQSPHYQQQQQQQQRHYSSQTPPVGTGTESYLSVSGLSAGGFYAPPCVAAAPVQQQGARTAHCRSAAIALLGTSASMDEDLQEWLVLETMRKLQNETPLDHDAAEKDAAIALMATAATSVGMSAGFSAQPSVASAGASAAATPTTAGGPGAGYLMGSVSSTSLAARSVNLIDLDASSTGSVAAAVVAADDDLRRRFAVLAGGSPQVVGWSQPAIDMFSDMFGATRTAPRPPMAAAAAAVPFVNAPPPFPGAAVPPALGGFESAADLFGDIPAFVFPLVPAAVCSAPVPSRRGGLVYNDKGVVYEDQNVQVCDRF
ncbi:hypothetical protein FOA52_012667 [Chlamydomonas sp. UWO 241]|nr:hypothetical protein FOA52_012667 [Chlamydomonas sp. UWO 241]